MHQLKKLLILALLLWIPAISLWAQTIVQTTDVTVVYNNNQSPSDFENVTKFYFSGDNLMLDQAGVVTSVPVSTIRRLELDAVSTVIGGTSDWGDNAILIYPNPTSDHLYFATNVEQNVQVSVFALNGQLLQQQQLNTSESLDVSNLPRGMYVIRVNEQTYKFSKF
ncbi:MAG: T9SS type A sorting domain-containing protein [Bacteroidales bacterium]|nr:T9SS type A sorting domain-containing protein [Bacteroidales bacterium]